jgi:hypothetical protein
MVVFTLPPDIAASEWLYMDAPLQIPDAPDARIKLNTLDRYKAHVRSPHRLADRFRIGRIILVRFDVWLDELRGHQSHRMSDAL